MKKVATFDIEANGLLEEATTVWCAVVREHTNDSTRKVTRFTPDTITDLCDFLSTFDVLIGHNCIGYDFPLLRKVFGWEFSGTKVDTLLMSRMQRPQRETPKGMKGGTPHSVEAWGYRFGEYKLEHEDWSQYSPEMLARCERDCDIQFRIYHALLEEGKGEGWREAHLLNHKLFHYLQKQEEYGWLVDRSHMDRSVWFLNRWIGLIDSVIVPSLPLLVEPLETKTQGEYGFLKKPFKKDGTLSEASRRYSEEHGISSYIAGPFSRVAFRPVDLNSNAETKSFLLSEGWEPLEWNTNSAGQRTSPKFSKDDPFIGIEGRVGKLIARRIQCRQRLSVLQGWIANIREDGRIGAAVAGVATTGRLRHSVIVNVPSPHSKAFFAKWMRQCFSSKEGYVLIGTDSKGNQVRQLAARMGDDEFTHAALYGNSDDGTDIHSVNQRKSGVPSRSLAKNVFYGFTFGAGDAKIGKLIKGNSDAGRKLKETFLSGLPKMKDMLDKMVAEWRSTAQRWYNPKYGRMEYKNGYIKGLDGRPILVEDEHTILVYFLQSDEAIQMAAAYVWLNKMLEKKYVYGKDYGFVIWYHDEWQIECRKEIADDVAALSNRAIAWAGEYYKIPVQHEGESKIGKNWYETH